jgi:hypothetical protein
MLRVKFVLVCEGPSDRGLVRHLEALCIRAGADEAIGDAPDLGLLPVPPGKSMDKQVEAVLALVADVNLLFIHRDADARDSSEVRRRLMETLSRRNDLPIHVLIVPIQELEAWLLVDPQAIREVVSNPRGTVDLDIPPVHRIESTARPKERLHAALRLASESRGRALDRLKHEIPHLHAVLLERLDLDGPVTRLSSWQSLISDVDAAIATMAKPPPPRGRASKVKIRRAR